MLPKEADLFIKDKEITDLNDTIKKQKKEILKQKILKLIGFTAAVVLPITTIILTVKHSLHFTYILLLTLNYLK